MTSKLLFTSIIFAGAVQGLFQILLLLNKKDSVPGRKYLLLWLFLLSIQLFFYFDSLESVPIFGQFVSIIAFSIPILSAPVLYQYMLSISFHKNIGLFNGAIYIMPWLAFLLFTLTARSMHPQGIVMRFGYPHFEHYISPSIIYLFTLPLAIIPGSYALLGFLALIRYQKSLPDKYSYTEYINLNWLKWLGITIPLLFLLLFSFIRFGSRLVVSPDKIFLFVGAVLSIYVFLVSFFSLRQSDWFLSATFKINLDDLDENTSLGVPYKKSGLNQFAVQEIYERLLVHMESQKSYLREDLSLSMLAKELSLNSNHLSQVINQQSGGNFFSFVNTYRVNEVKQKLLDPAFSHLSILGIAFDCGFRSKSAFNRIFKEIVGMGPSEYQQKNR